MPQLIKNNLFLEFSLWIFSRAIIFFLFLYIFQYSLVNYNTIQKGIAKKIWYLVDLNAFDYLVNFHEIPQKPDKRMMSSYVFFYKKMVEYFPQEADAYILLGYCHYYLDEEATAIKMFEEAMRLEPNLFWVPYNLGIIYYYQGEYEKALEYTDKALKIRSEETVTLLLKSKIFFPNLISEPMALRLNERLAQAFLVASELKYLSQISLDKNADLELKQSAKEAQQQKKYSLQLF